MPNTPLFDFPYPDPLDAPDGPAQLQSLAEAVEAALDDIYAGISFGGAVAVGGNLSTDGNLTVSGSVTIGGSVDAGEISGTLVESSGDIAAGGDIYSHGTAVTRLVKGKLHTGSLVDTSTTSTTTWQNITSANIQNIPVIAGHAYRADFQVAVSSTVTNDRIRYSLWNGSTSTGSQCGTIIPIVRVEQSGTFRVQSFSFVWKAENTEIISNLNLYMIRYSGSGEVSTRIENSSFHGLVYDLGPAGVISNL